MPLAVFSARRSTPVSQGLEHRNEAMTSTSWRDVFSTNQPPAKDGVPTISPPSARHVASPSLCHALRLLALTGCNPWCFSVCVKAAMPTHKISPAATRNEWPFDMLFL